MPPQCIVFLFEYSLGKWVCWEQMNQLLLPTWPRSAQLVGPRLWKHFKQVLYLSVSFISLFLFPNVKEKKKQYKLGHFFSVGPVFPAQVEVQGMWAKLARLQTQRQSSSLLFSSVCMPLTHGSDLVYVFEMSHSPNLWTLFREWALSWLDPVWLTRRNAFTRSFFFFFLIPRHSFATTFLVHWLNFPPLMEYKGCEAKSSKGFLWRVPQIRLPGWRFAVTCTCGWRNVHLWIQRRHIPLT